jgi:uncharacterized damage-inducible protein DinB
MSAAHTAALVQCASSSEIVCVSNPYVMLPELRDLFAYNHWANERILGSCEPLSAADLTRELGGSFPSVWSTLTHIYGAEITWLARWNGTPAGSWPDLGDIDDVSRLREKWQSLWERQSRCIADATDEDVRRMMPIQFRDGTTLEQQMGATMRHCMNHSTYHRGQITNFLRMLGAKAVGTDLVTYYREHPPSE